MLKPGSKEKRETPMAICLKNYSKPSLPNNKSLKNKERNFSNVRNSI
jgi:hypothetical protein